MGTKNKINFKGISIFIAILAFTFSTNINALGNGNNGNNRNGNSNNGQANGGGTNNNNGQHNNNSGSTQTNGNSTNNNGNGGNSGGGSTSVPLDGGLGILLLGAAAFGARKLRTEKK